MFIFQRDVLFGQFVKFVKICQNVSFMMGEFPPIKNVDKNNSQNILELNHAKQHGTENC